MTTIETRGVRSPAMTATYAQIDSPVGPLLAAATDRGMMALERDRHGKQAFLRGIGAVVGGLEERPERFEALGRQLAEYFAGRRRRFDEPLDWRLVHGFTRRVLQATSRIPYGSVATYGELAAEAGSPRAARAAGNAQASNPIMILVPCHRVVPASGGIGRYGGGEDMKAFLLSLEGVRL